MCASLNSEAGRDAGVQSTPDREVPISEQEQDRVGRSVSSHTRKKTTTTYLTAGHRGMAQKPKKAKARKS